ncbi:MAG: hypothetical protein KBE41_04425 [Lutibacter sp.]|nr:hypothetical protein [Lutibacter sp.]MBP9600728.1 hypothetical protein [Lutibacter sp.]
MDKRLFHKLFPLLILINTFLSVNQWSKLPLGNFFIELIVNVVIIFFIFWYKRNFFRPRNKSDYGIISIYFLWTLLTVVRGVFVAENYWEWKQLLTGTFTLALPLFVYVFYSPLVLRNVLRFWIKYALPLFVLFFVWVIVADSYHYYLAPVLLLSCFLPILPRKWQLIFIVLLLVMMFADFGARSQVIKATIALLMSLAYLLSKYLSSRILKIAHWMFYILPLVLLYLGFTGVFNIYEGLSSNKGKYIESKLVDGEHVVDDLSADTRTFIYVEVIESALKHGYTFWGRTPARGNDSMAFGAYQAEDLKTGRYERHSNEVCFPNVFTWLGLIGLIMYCFIYLKSSYLAVYKSNNIFVKLIGVYIAFHFTFGWVEDFNRFDITNISLWMMIAMGFSERFRRMNNWQFKIWGRSIVRTFH